ncbi:MAG: DUF2341 domain-containing protein, partial [Candidatus Nanohaloarchaea archaeon]|nr:DUF2341 domain-containing protein [Candidatus Nanohaloarchaea archaeon]
AFASSGAAWWDQSWEYRKPIDVTEQSGRDLTDYQVKVVVDTSSSKFQSDCGDIRFVDSDDSTTLEYWIKEGCGTSTTTIWVKVPTLAASSTETIYMYYGNSGASSVSNAESTFMLYDDFEGGLEAGWKKSTSGGGSITVSNGIVDIHAQDSDENAKLIHGSATCENCAIDMVAKATFGDAYYANRFGFKKSLSSGSTVHAEHSEDWGSDDCNEVGNDNALVKTQYLSVNDGDSTINRCEGDWDPTTYQKWTFRYQSGTEADVLLDGSQVISYSTDIPTKQLAPWFSAGTWGGSGEGDSEIWVKWIRMRKYAEPTPSISVGSEQTHPDPPTSPDPSDGATDVSTSPSLSAYYDDPDGHSGTLTFYDGGGSKIGSCSVSDASSCSVTWSGLSTGTTYNWYVTATDSTGAKETGATWSFTTNHYPAIEQDAAFTDSSTDHVFDIGAAVSDGDGDGDISSCTVFYTDTDGNSGTVAGSVGTGFGTSTEASCNASISRSTSNVQVGEQLDIIVQFTDGNGRKANTTTAQHAVPNHAPTVVQGNAFDNASAEHMFNVTAVGKDTDAGSSELSSCTVT